MKIATFNVNGITARLPNSSPGWNKHVPMSSACRN